MSLKVFNIEGKSTGTVDVPAELLEKRVSRSLLHRVVVSYEANLRQGSACTKTKGERKGTGKKPWRQKGTGRARAGSFRSPLWRGGGVIFGPKPKDYRMKMSKKERDLALTGAVVGKLKDDEVLVIDSMDLKEPKTRIVANFIEKAEVGQSVLFVSAEKAAGFVRASKNIPKVSSFPLQDLNALEVLRARKIVFEKAAFEKFTGAAS